MLRRGLFAIKKQEPKVPQNQTSEDEVYVDSNDGYKIKLSDWGFQAAGQVGGTESGFKIHIHRLYREFVDKMKSDEEARIKNLEPVRNKLVDLQAKVEQIGSKITHLKESKIPKEQDRIDELKREILDLQNGKQGNKAGWLSFIIGGVILLSLSIYLVIFYSSASYSAFFKEFSMTDIGVANNIFDAQAFSKAFQHGWTEIILIGTMPFIFLGLGFLIHKIGKSDGFTKYFKIAGLLTVTFLFDSILAYEITEKIYNVEASANIFVQEMPEYTISMALKDVKFWMIIFAGFVVYIVWGLVFDFFEEAHESRSSNHREITGKRVKIKDCHTRLDAHNEDLQKLREERAGVLGEITKCETLIDGNAFIFNPKDFEVWLLQFATGWCNWLNNNHKPHESIKKVHIVVTEFMAEIQSRYTDLFSKELNVVS